MQKWPGFAQVTYTSFSAHLLKTKKKYKINYLDTHHLREVTAIAGDMCK